MNRCRWLVFLLALLALQVCAWGQTQEQPQQPPQEEEAKPIETASDFTPRPSFMSRVGNGIGYQSGYSRLGVFIPLRQEDADFMTFSDARFLVDYSGRLGGSVGLGHRVYNDYFDRTFGAYLYGDVRNTDLATFSQMSGGFETLGQWWDLRSNWYAPIALRSAGANTFIPISNPYLAGNNILATGLKQTNQTMTGVDMTMSVKIPRTPNIRLFAGPYWFTGQGTSDAIGAKIGVDAQLGDYANTNLAFQTDRVFGTNVLFGLSFAFPGSRPNPHRGDIPVANRLADNVEKLDLVVVDQQQREGAYAFTDPRTGAPVQVLYVDQTAAPNGNGTVEHPFANLVQAQNALVSNDILFVKNGTYFTALTLPKNVSVLGDGTMQTVNTLQGTIAFPIFTPGAVETIFNINGPAITLNNGDLVSGMTINGNDTKFTGSGQGIVGGGTNNVTVENNTIFAVADEGIKLSGSGNITVFHNNVSDGGNDGIQVNANNAQSQTLLIANNTVSNVAGDGLKFNINNNASAQASVIGNTITGVGKSGIFVQGLSGNSPSSFYSITNNTINQSAGSSSQAAIKVLNTSSTVGTVITGNTINMSSAGTNGIFLNTESSGILSATVSQNTITGAYSNGISMLSQGGSILMASVTNNTMSGNFTTGISVANADNSSLVTAVNNNAVTGASQSGIAVSQTGTGSLQTSVFSNTITQSSGAASNAAIFLNPTGMAGSNFAVSAQNNIITLNDANLNGVLVASTGVADATVTLSNNAISGTYGSGMAFTSNNNSNLSATVNSNGMTGTFQHGISATSSDSSLMNLTLGSNTIVNATSQGVLLAAHNLSNLNVTATGNSVTGSGAAGISLQTFDTANGRAQFLNNTMLTGNGSPESDLFAQTNGGLLQLKAVNNATGGDIQFLSSSGLFQVDGNPVTLNPGATVTVGPGVITGANNFP